MLMYCDTSQNNTRLIFVVITNGIVFFREVFIFGSFLACILVYVHPHIFTNNEYRSEAIQNKQKKTKFVVNQIFLISVITRSDYILGDVQVQYKLTLKY